MKKLEKQESGKYIKKEVKKETHTTLNSNFQLLNSKSGITLISLVVTIVVLLILAGITINLVLADGGIFGKTEEASEAQKKAEVEDKVGLILADALVEKATYGTKLKEYLQKENIPIVAEDDETITIEVDGYTVVIDKETFEIGNIEENAKSVRISLDSKTAKLNVVVNCEIGLGDDMAVLAWSYVQSNTEIGEDETKYENIYTTSTLNLEAETEGEYYLHLLVEDKKQGIKKEYIEGPVLIGNYVESITLDKTEIALDVGGTEKLTATALPSDASNTNVNWKSSNEEVAKVSSTNTASGTEVTVTAVSLGTAIITAEAADGSGKTASCTVKVTESVPTIEGSSATDHTAKSLNYSWEEMNTIAKVISDNFGTGTNQVNKGTEEVTVTANGKSYTVGVGDTINLTDTSNKNYTVRILGFNHDKLTNPKAYNSEETDTTVYAGISFEFVSFLTGTTYKYMNTSATSANGWAATKMRRDLNGYTTVDAAQSGELAGLGATLTNKTYIKQVEKNYIKTYNTASSVTTCSDYLWLLSTSEIWNNGYSTGCYGYAVTSESTMYDSNDTQTQYKYYAKNLGSTAYNTSTDITKKPTTSSQITWWLRSTYRGGSMGFCYVTNYGGTNTGNATTDMGVAPGFSI